MSSQRAASFDDKDAHTVEAVAVKDNIPESLRGLDEDELRAIEKTVVRKADIFIM